MKKTKILITVDTEHSIGGAFRNPKLKPVGNEKRIFGKIGNEYYGIPLIMDIADEYGIPITFFVEVLNHHYFGKDESKEVCQYILKRGHDVQLHLHPCYLNFKEAYPAKLKYSDNMSDYCLSDQVKLIEEGKKLLQEYGINSPVAFRAGNYGADGNTLVALKKNNFLYDSSYNLSYQKYKKITEEKINDCTNMNGVFEFPITSFIEALPFTGKRYRPLDLNGVGVNEMITVLNDAKASGIDYVTIILHSFSFIKSMDLQYRKMKIRKNIIKRFRKLCAFLNENSDRLDTIQFAKVIERGNNNGLDQKEFICNKVPCVYSVLRGIDQIVSEWV